MSDEKPIDDIGNFDISKTVPWNAKCDRRKVVGEVTERADLNTIGIRATDLLHPGDPVSRDIGPQLPERVPGLTQTEVDALIGDIADVNRQLVCEFGTYAPKPDRSTTYERDTEKARAEIEQLMLADVRQVNREFRQDLHDRNIEDQSKYRAECRERVKSAATKTEADIAQAEWDDWERVVAANEKARQIVEEQHRETMRKIDRDIDQSNREILMGKPDEQRIARATRMVDQIDPLPAILAALGEIGERLGRIEAYMQAQVSKI